MPLFTPPTQKQGVATGDRLFDRYTVDVGLSVVKRDGVYATIPFPWLGEIADLTEGVDYFLGGRTYVVSDAQATELNNAGYTTVADAGYGEAPYGTQGYGF